MSEGQTGRWIGISALGALSLAAACASGCASPPKVEPPPRPAAPLGPLPRSSIAAVLEHRVDLGLSDDQVQKLQARDQQRELADAQLRSELAAATAGGSSSSTSGGPGMGSAPAAGMGGMGGRRGGGRMGRMGQSPGATAGSRAQALQEKLDDDDTQAFLQAEPIFTDAQREQAEAVAEKYREDLFDRRQPSAR